MKKSGPLEKLFSNNRKWAEGTLAQDRDFFKKLENQQNPEYLWIGCSDSRVPANQIVGLLPGEVFVHRNVANVVVYSDLNCLSVIQFAVDVLKVKHIIVCGHYGCGGVHAALHRKRLGLIDNWLHHVRDVGDRYGDLLNAQDQKAWDTLCELNVIEQAVHVAETTIVQDAWKRGQELTIHGLVYSLKDGVLKDLAMTIATIEETEIHYKQAVERVTQGMES